LSCNRFGTMLGLAHAAMTAEGDNSVLMQKVAKEHLSHLSKNGFPSPVEAKEDISDKMYAYRLLQDRERALYERLGKNTASAGKEGLFATWMMEESDLIQACGRAFAERLIADRFLLAIEEADPDLKPILDTLFSLYAVNTLERNLAQLVIAGVVKREQMADIRLRSAALCAQLGPQALAVAESFAATPEMLSAPIARDWVQYNEYDNQGELDGF